MASRQESTQIKIGYNNTWPLEKLADIYISIFTWEVLPWHYTLTHSQPGNSNNRFVCMNGWVDVNIHYIHYVYSLQIGIFIIYTNISSLTTHPSIILRVSGSWTIDQTFTIDKLFRWEFQFYTLHPNLEIILKVLIQM